MIVVMPSGWTPSGWQIMTADATKDPFNGELLQDIHLSRRTSQALSDGPSERE
jgi:hypothetical protein